MEKYTAIKDRASKYTMVLDQVVKFREEWEKSLKQDIINKTEKVLDQTGIKGTIGVEERFENLESITISLGKTISGIAEHVDDKTKRTIIKDKGSLIYSQLFNGKIQVWMSYPLIEGLMQPKPPKLIGIYGPPEFNEDLILDNFDEFFKELIEWENYDDDQPNGKKVSRIGFGNSQNEQD